MEITPEKRLTQTEIDAQFSEKGMLAHFQNTCKPHTVASPDDFRFMPTLRRRKHGNWEFVEFRDSDGNPQCKYRARATVMEGEEEIGQNVHILWYRDKEGQIFVVDNLDFGLLGV